MSSNVWIKKVWEFDATLLPVLVSGEHLIQNRFEQDLKKWWDHSKEFNWKMKGMFLKD